jgi:hypothetical protein
MDVSRRLHMMFEFNNNNKNTGSVVEFRPLEYEVKSKRLTVQYESKVYGGQNRVSLF